LQNMFFLFKETNLNSLYFFDLFEFWLSDVNWNQCLCQKGDIISDSSKGFELTSFRSKFFIFCLCIRQSSKKKISNRAGRPITKTLFEKQP
jgi:hypothetical protein